MSVGYLDTLRGMLAKDLRIELRSKEVLFTLVLFGLVMVLVFAFGFASDEKTSRAVLPGILWATLLFSGTLGIGRTFGREARDGAFQALVLSPAPRSAVLLAKVTVNLALMLFVMALLTPVLAVMLRVDLSPCAGIIALQLTLGALGFAVVGTPLAVMAINARFAEVLLPLVVFPLAAPVLICGVNGTGAVLGTVIDPDPLPWLRMTAAFDAIYFAGGLFLFERMVTE
jgi:heme exporter protein CcmB